MAVRDAARLAQHVSLTCNTDRFVAALHRRLRRPARDCYDADVSGEAGASLESELYALFVGTGLIVSVAMRASVTGLPA